MIDKFNESLYKIEEAYNGHYSVKIQMDSDSDILNLIDDSYKYVWIIGHSEYLNEWTPSNNTLFSRESDPNKVSVSGHSYGGISACQTSLFFGS